MNRILPCLLLVSAPSLACDWIVKASVSPMTDQKACTIYSPSARLGVGVEGSNVSFMSGSPYREDYLTVRVDDAPAITLSRESRSTGAYKTDARDLLAQLLSGSRVRVNYRGRNGFVDGDASICNLPDLIRSCR